MSVLRRVTTPLAVAAVSLAVLAGCTPADETPEPEPTGTTAPTTDPTPEPTTGTVGIPIDATCSQLVSDDTLYVYNPNFGAADFTPESGTAAASAIAYQGVACRWQNQSSGANIDVSVAHLDDETLTALKNAAFADSEMVPTYGDEAYFRVTDGVGEAQVFQGGFWIVAESTVFFEPGDATELIQSVLAGLGE